MKKNKKKIEKKVTYKFPFLQFFALIALILVLFGSLVIGKEIKKNTTYKGYLTYIQKTKIVLYPDITQKDQKSYLESWIKYNRIFFSSFFNEIPELKKYLLGIEQDFSAGKFTETYKYIEETRKLLTKHFKNKQYYNQTIMMEELLSLILNMENSIKQNDGATLMNQYNDFNSKFSYVAPSLIKTDVIKVGNLMDQLYKQALFNNLKQANLIYHEIKKQFINSYQDFQVK